MMHPGNIYFVLATTLGFASLSTVALGQPVHNLTQGTDHATIQEAIDAAVSSDEIEVDPGSYVENIDFLGKNITVRSTDPFDPAVVESTIIDGGGLDTVVTLSAGVISGFTITGGANTGIDAGGVHAIGTAVVSYNLITGNSADQKGGGVTAEDNVRVRNNRIVSNIGGNRAGGVNARNTALVMDNFIAFNEAISGGGGIRARESSIIRNNTIVFNSSTDTGGGVLGGGGILAEDKSLILSNIIAFSTDGVGLHAKVGENVTADYNCVFGNFDGPYGGDAAPGANDVNADPLLEVDNIHLTELSPCINAGEPSLIAFVDEADLDGQPRIGDGRVEIGADELHQDCNDNEIPDEFEFPSGSGLFTAAKKYEGGIAPSFLAVGDLNGDGWADLVLLSEEEDEYDNDEEVSVLLNKGDGSFGPEMQILSVSADLKSAVIGDLNNDGKPDLIAIHNSAAVLLGNGDGTFSAPTNLFVGSFPRFAAIGDLDGDGILDLVVAGQDVAVLLGSGDGTFASPVFSNLGGQTDDVALGDLNADGNLDLAVTVGVDVVVVLGNGNGTFGDGEAYLIGGDPNSIVIGDLDGDGDLDLALSNGDTDQVSVLLGNGDGTFGDAVQYTVTPKASNVAKGDLDNDGDLDLVVVAPWGEPVSILRNAGDGTFTFEEVFSFNQFDDASYVVVSDLDVDGNLDLVLTTQGLFGATLNVAVLPGHGDGSFGETFFDAGAFASGVDVADLDGDGDLDIAVLNRDDGDISILLNHGDGTFAHQVRYGDLGDSAWAIEIADLNNDGILDVVGGAFDDSYLQMFFGRGDGTFSFGGQVELDGDRVRSIEAGDLNGDRIMDMAVGNTQGVVILLGTGGGAFAPPVAFSTGQGTEDLVLGDVDNDGDLDVAVTGENGDAHVLRGNGDGTFDPAVTYAVSSAQAVALVDLDQDGFLELVVAEGSSVTVFINNGFGIFHEGTSQAVSSVGFIFLATGDVNGDGFADVVTQGADLLLGNGDGTLTPILGFGYGDKRDVAVGDMDGDGDVDLVVAYGSNNDVAIFFQNDGDCNGNLIPDDCDIAEGTSADCNGNGRPDDCEPDCNGNGLADDCDIASGTSQDCTGNGIPDECEPDCNGNGLADSCDIAGGTSADCNANEIPDECFELEFDCNGNSVPDTCDIAEGISEDCNENGVPDGCELTSGTVDDCNENGIPDECEPDCNANGLQDECDIAEGTSEDCNENGVPDECDILFVEHVVSTTLADPATVFAVDLDGDGDIDILSASDINDPFGSEIDDSIIWYENTDGRGTFSPQHIITTGVNRVTSLFAADLDGDGDADVLSASTDDNKIAWYENTDGQGSFGPQQVITTDAGGANFVFAADLDGDGDLDVLSASGDDGKIAWYENIDGLGEFGPQLIIDTLADSGVTVVAADLDGDGDADVLATVSSADSRIIWYENTDGLGNFGPQLIIDAEAVNPVSVVAADLDGDGDADVIFAGGSGGDRIAWYENTDGLGSFGPQQVITTAVDGANSVFAVDLDGDGDTDVLSSSNDDSKIAWYENIDGMGCFGPQQVITIAADGAQSVFAADLDGDGDPDVLSASRLDDKIAWYANPVERDCNGNTVVDSCDIADSTSQDLDGNGVPDECEPDCNGNGVADSCDISSEISEDCNLNQVPDECDLESGTSYDCNENGIPDGCESMFIEQIITTELIGSISVFAADIDGDGDADVLSSSETDNTIAWYENTDGMGSFGPQQVITTVLNHATDVFAADLDGDGDIDVLSAASVGQFQIAWYENTDGLGNFGPLRPISSSDNTAQNTVFAADLDGDGDNDVLEAAANADEIAWYENTDGLGNFGGRQVITSLADLASSVFAVDLDGDGDADVLSASSGDDKIAWYENTDGLGSFGPQQIITTATDYPTSVFAADLDGDGDADVLSASMFDDKIAWYENTDGLGSFGPQQIISATGSGNVYAADLDGDGDLDVLSSTNEDEIVWYENTDGLGSFGPQQIISTTDSGIVFAADLDGDGRSDVLAAFLGPEQIVWYLTPEGIHDCNDNDVPDACDIADGTSEDTDDDGVPDECQETPCEGDANGDGTVDPLDSGFVLARFGCPVGTGNPDCDAADVNGDGEVNPLDSGFVLARFGDCG